MMICMHLHVIYRILNFTALLFRNMIHDFVGLHLFCDSIIRTLFWITYGTLYKCICRRQWAKRCGHLKHELTTYKTIHASTFFQRKARPNSQLKDSLPRRAIPNQTSTYRTKIPILITLSQSKANWKPYLHIYVQNHFILARRESVIIL